MILNVYKEKNMTSRDVVNILCKHFNTKKIGHTGTLDPIATGVLIICIDNDTKLVSLITAKRKTYIATMKLGIETDTLDVTGNIINRKPFDVNKELIEETLKSFVGDSIQEVPKYSAIKVNGKKLYEYARNNIEVEIPKRNINIKSIELIHFDNDEITFKVDVSKGTYIRSLISDIAKKLGTLGTMQDLCRVKQGEFSIDDSAKISDILDDNYKVISYDEVFSDIPKISMDDLLYKKVINGSKLNMNLNKEEVIFTYNNEFIALYYQDNDVARLKYLFKKL